MSREGPSVVIVGAAGFTNLGDDAILAAMLQELASALPGAVFTVASGSPERLERLAVNAVSLETHALDAALAHADLAIVGGGGFLYDYDGILSPHDFLRGDRTFMYPYFRAALTARARDVPVYFYALGVESLVTPVGRALTRDFLSLGDAITVRDPLSQAELRAAGVSRRVDVTADPAVRLIPPTRPWAGRPEGCVVGFVPRLWLRFAGGWTSSAEQYYGRYCSWLAAAADHVCEAWDATPMFLPGQRYNDDDAEAAESIVALMRHRDRVVVVTDVDTLVDYHALLAGLDALVSARLHPLILAATAGVPGVGIVVSAKVAAFLSALGVQELAVWPWAASSRRLAAALDDALGGGEELAARLAAGIGEQRRAAARNPELAASLVAQGGV